MTNFPIGTEVEGFWGAMHPTNEGTIVGYFNNKFGYNEIEIEWAHADNCETLPTLHPADKLKTMGDPGIGIFVIEARL